LLFSLPFSFSSSSFSFSSFFSTASFSLRATKAASALVDAAAGEAPAYYSGTCYYMRLESVAFSLILIYS